MSLQELKEQAHQLPVSVGEASAKETRLELVRAIIESLQDVPTQPPERSRIIKQMKGLLKTDQLAPTDEQVESMLEERRVEKYL
ncbi:MAG: hypothetical protein V7L04_24640 [Nostoc sp.]|uniref:hypothetical protein n=1 Tax=Nostoc sp. TaxID=1180 RepID=UPI002FF7F9C8